MAGLNFEPREQSEGSQRIQRASAADRRRVAPPRANFAAAQPEEQLAAVGSDQSRVRTGRQPSDEEIYVWNEFMRKRGWNDEISETLKRRKKEAGMAGRSEIETMFSFIDADEGRSLVGTH